MKAARKLLNNILTPQAVSVLGASRYLRYLTTFAVYLPKIVRSGDLRPLDQAMGLQTRRFRYRGKEFTFDCRFCDEQIGQCTYAFGLVREIYIRDCYFKHLPRRVYDTARVVVDLGANRGVFSVLMAASGVASGVASGGGAGFVLSIEAREIYRNVIQHQMQANGFTHYAVEIGFVGAGGADAALDTPRFKMEDLLSRHRLQSVDLMKMDIEGSEFALFQSPTWLQPVKAITMEVHPSCGDPREILAVLHDHGFDHAFADEDLTQLSDARWAKFIYAWRRG